MGLGKAAMGLGKFMLGVGKFIVESMFDGIQSDARSYSRRSDLSDDQREAFSKIADNMDNLKGVVTGERRIFGGESENDADEW